MAKREGKWISLKSYKSIYKSLGDKVGFRTKSKSFDDYGAMVTANAPNNTVYAQIRRNIAYMNSAT
jgi:hypothetical protein